MPSIANHWGRPLPTLAEVASDNTLRGDLHRGLVEMLGGTNDASTDAVASNVLDAAARGGFDHERTIHALLESAGLLGGGQRDLRNEIDHLYRLSSSWLVGSSLIDFGCGDGSMARRYADGGLEVTLTDVLEPQELTELALPYVRTSPDGFTPLPDGAFDNAIAFGVLHHCQDPDQSIAEIVRLIRPGGRIVIVESVYAVHSGDIAEGKTIMPATFAYLSEEQQFRYTMFFDHLVNRVVGAYNEEPDMKINVPYNYNTPSGWNNAFSRAGAAVVNTVHLEVQVGRAPLHHTLHVYGR